MKFKLKELLKEKGYIRGPFGSSLKRKELKTEGIPVYEQQNVINNNRDFRYYIDNEKYEEFKRFTVEENDLLITCSGTVGKVSIIEPLDKKGIISQALLILRVNTNFIIPKYLYYFFSSKKGFNCLVSHCMGSVQINIAKREVIENIELEIPSIEIQKKIVLILEKIDRKIELNNKINDNLYEISRKIFDKLYKDSENWQECKIQDIGLYITDYVANGSFKSLSDNIKIYNTKNYALFIRNTDLKVNFTKERKYVDEHSYNFLSKSKLTGRELIISNVGDVGSIYLCPLYKIPMTLGNNVIMLDSKDLKVNYNYYLYYFFLSATGQYLIDGITGGSAQPKFNKTDLRNSIIKIPSENKIIEFNKNIIPMYDIIEKNIMENGTLSKLRDTLIPKLMNGEINLENIEI